VPTRAERVDSMKSLIGLASTVLGGVLAVGMAGAALAHSSAPPKELRAVVNGVADTPQGSLPHAFLNLDVWPDSLAGEHGDDGGPHPDWVSYGPSSNLVLPAHSLVTMTIKQYDTGEAITNPYFAQVHGTVDGTATVDGHPVRAVDPETVGHTFTVHALITDQDPLFVSVPLPAVADESPMLANGYAAPHVITFSFITGGAGDYVWQCEFPCGDGTYAKFGGPMSEQAYMAGTVRVEAKA